MHRNLAIFNFLSVVLLIMVTYYTQAIELNDNTIGSLSREYRNLFTPAGYAFSIWGLIYLGLLAYCFFQFRRAYFSSKESEFISQTGPWFIFANLANSAWVIVWLYELTGLSVIFMFLALFSLVQIVRKTGMERWDAPPSIIIFSWWPICFYSGWITVASIANVSAFLSKTGWNGWILNETQWTILLLFTAIAINALMIYRRNMREFAAVGVWAVFAVFVRHQEKHPAIAYAALAGAVILLAYILYHGYLNRSTNPFTRLFKKEEVDYYGDSLTKS